VQILQPAVANFNPVSPNRSRTIGLSLFFGFSLVALALFLKRFFYLQVAIPQRNRTIDPHSGLG